jgi:hypothetical protein
MYPLRYLVDSTGFLPPEHLQDGFLLRLLIVLPIRGRSCHQVNNLFRHRALEREHANAKLVEQT